MADERGHLTGHQLNYLRGLVRMDIRKRERALARFAPKPGQWLAEAEEARAKQERHVVFARATLHELDLAARPILREVRRQRRNLA
jgi:hypothetical protein